MAYSQKGEVAVTTLEAGRDLDARIAEKVFGCHLARGVTGEPVCCCDFGPHTKSKFEMALKAYSTDISAAWQVFETALIRVGTASISADMEDWGRGAFTASKADQVVTVTIGEWSVTAPVCEAICRAALAAVGEVPAL